jgi:hypothetical protein
MPAKEIPMSRAKKVLLVDVDTDIESLIVRHPSGDEEEIAVIGVDDDETDTHDGAADLADSSD